MKVYRDLEGNVVNIGEWEFITALEESSTGVETLVICNPIPEGVSFMEEEIVVGWEGGRYAVDDPRRLN